MIANFRNTLENVDPQLLNLDRLETLQINLGNRCNQSCSHCHVQAGPNGDKIMSKTVMEDIIDFLNENISLCADVTGGCPELNPNFKFFIESICNNQRLVMIRTNLTIFSEPLMAWIPQWYSKNKIVLIASLPCYTAENVDQQRGRDTFIKSIKALKMLNKLGYGTDSDLELNLTYNPGGVFLPDSQKQLESIYKKELYDKYGIRFNNLFTITNAPIGRFKKYLQANGKLQGYLQLLVEKFNPAAARNIMCQTLLSVDYRGLVHNCDFNQALNLPITDHMGKAVTIGQLQNILQDNIEIITDEHCFCCTSGAGSSCTGSIAD